MSIDVLDNKPGRCQYMSIDNANVRLKVLTYFIAQYNCSTNIHKHIQVKTINYKHRVKGSSHNV